MDILFDAAAMKNGEGGVLTMLVWTRNMLLLSNILGNCYFN